MNHDVGPHRHCKGGLYNVQCYATYVTGNYLRELVVYENAETGAKFARDYSDFIEVVQWPDGEMRPRFVKLV